MRCSTSRPCQNALIGQQHLTEPPEHCLTGGRQCEGLGQQIFQESDKEERCNTIYLAGIMNMHHERLRQPWPAVDS